MARINCGNCDQKHTSVDEVRACYAGETPRRSEVTMADAVSDDELVAMARNRSATGPAATEKQIGFLNKLVNSRDIEALSGENYERAFDLATDSGKFISKSEASNLIGALLELPEEGATGTRSADVPEGIHALDGTFFKVQVAIHGSGRKYAKQWNGSKWIYESGAISRLSDDTVATAEQATRFGRLYGRCVYCSHELTDERSIAVGYGPVCAENNGLPWGHVAEGSDA